MNRVREKWIDILKGIAIVLVVMGHVVTSYHTSKLLLDSSFFNFIKTLVYTFHMPLFFVVSGYLAAVALNNHSLTEAVVKKLVAYGIPYVLFSVFGFLAKLFARSVVNSPYEFTDLLLIFVYPMSSLWFIYALLLISIISLVLHHIYPKYNPYVVLFVSLGCKFITELIYRSGAVSNSWIFDSVLYDVCRYFFWFALGECVKKSFVQSKKMSIQNLNWVWVIFASVVFIGMVYIMNFYHVDLFITDILLALLGSSLCVICAIKISHSKMLEFLGQQTFPIYLLHGYVISFTRIVLNKLAVPLFGGIVPLIACTVLGIVMPLIAYILSTKIRGLDFCFSPSKYIFGNAQLRKHS